MNSYLAGISSFTAVIELLTGLHIGAGNNEIHIGGTDNPVIKNPLTGRPYIPGSSLKGKMRGLLEWRYGLVSDGKPVGFSHLPGLSGEQKSQAEQILRLFGGAPEGAGSQADAARLGPTRLAFWDCQVCPQWLKSAGENNDEILLETKMENTIDRIKGAAIHPRSTERVPAGVRFQFRLSLRVHDQEDLTPMVYEGLRLLQVSGLGGSGSRGYGKIAFVNLQLDGVNVQSKIELAAAQTA